MIGIIGAMEEEVAALKSEMADAKVIFLYACVVIIQLSCSSM